MTALIFEFWNCLRVDRRTRTPAHLEPLFSFEGQSLVCFSLSMYILCISSLGFLFSFCFSSPVFSPHDGHKESWKQSLAGWMGRNANHRESDTHPTLLVTLLTNNLHNMSESKTTHLKTQDLSSLNVDELTALTPEVVSNFYWCMFTNESMDGERCSYSSTRSLVSLCILLTTSDGGY